MRLVCILAFLVLVAGCNNAAKETTSDVAKTHADSLRDDVMEAHEVGMAKSMKIREVRPRIQAIMDSISKLPASAQKVSSHYKMQLDSSMGQLTSAYNAMDAWMREYNMDSSFTDSSTQIKYLQSEKLKILKVNDGMINSLQKADSLLMKK